MKTVTFLLACASIFAQTKPAAPAEKSAFDKATLEAYLRHVELWIPQVGVKIDDVKKSTDMPGFFEVWVHLTYNGGTKDEKYFVSEDGHRVVKGEVFDINKNPFQANLDKLKIDGAPTFGPANAPVTLVVFSDFQCPVRKEEAQILRKNIAAAFPAKVKVYFKDFPLDSLHNWREPRRSRAGACTGRIQPPSGITSTGFTKNRGASAWITSTASFSRSLTKRGSTECRSAGASKAKRPRRK